MSISEEDKLKLKRYLLLLEAQKNDKMLEYIEEEYIKVSEEIKDKNDTKRKK